VRLFLVSTDIKNARFLLLSEKIFDHGKQEGRELTAKDVKRVQDGDSV